MDDGKKTKLTEKPSLREILASLEPLAPEDQLGPIDDSDLPPLDDIDYGWAMDEGRPITNDNLPTSPQQAPFPKIDWGDRAAKLDAYGPGPWVDEPDRVEWRSHGLPCLVRRVQDSGIWCGYVGVAEGHSLYGKDRTKLGELIVHGGVTTARPCDEHGVCHVPEPGEPGEPGEVWWIGFDCMHGGMDVVPFMLNPRHPFPIDARSTMFKSCEYRTVQYAVANVELLALQVARHAEPSDTDP